MFKHLLQRKVSTNDATETRRKNRLPKVWKLAGKTIKAA